MRLNFTEKGHGMKQNMKEQIALATTVRDAARKALDDAEAVWMAEWNSAANPFLAWETHKQAQRQEHRVSLIALWNIANQRLQELTKKSRKKKTAEFDL